MQHVADTMRGEGLVSRLVSLISLNVAKKITNVEGRGVMEQQSTCTKPKLTKNE